MLKVRTWLATVLIAGNESSRIMRSPERTTAGQTVRIYDLRLAAFSRKTKAARRVFRPHVTGPRQLRHCSSRSRAVGVYNTARARGTVFRIRMCTCARAALVKQSRRYNVCNRPRECGSCAGKLRAACLGCRLAARVLRQ